jgi:hypothetical protein
VRIDLDRFHLVGEVIDRVPQLEPRAGHREHSVSRGEDLPKIGSWNRSRSK